LLVYGRGIVAPFDAGAFQGFAQYGHRACVNIAKVSPYYANAASTKITATCF
jgi:hypothetical protein